MNLCVALLLNVFSEVRAAEEAAERASRERASAHPDEVMATPGKDGWQPLKDGDGDGDGANAAEEEEEEDDRLDPDQSVLPAYADSLINGLVVFSCLTLVGNLAPFLIGVAVQSGGYELPQILAYSVPLLYLASAAVFVAAGESAKEGAPPADAT